MTSPPGSLAPDSDAPKTPRAREASPLAEPLLKPADAAALLNVKPSWIYEAVRSGRLPCVKLGKHVRFLQTDLEGWVLEQRVAARR